MRRSTLLLLGWAFLGLAGRAGAAPPAMDVQHFTPHADRTGWFVTESAQTLRLFQPAFGLWLNYAEKPFLHSLEGALQDRVVNDLTTLDLQAAIGFGVADVAIDVPIHLYMVGDGLEAWGGPVSGTVMGDIRIVPKVRFLDPDKVGIGLGLALPVSLPSGDETRYLGRETVAFSPALLVTGHVGIFRIGGNVGYRLTSAEPVADLIAGRAFLFRAAASVHPHRVVDVGVELFGEALGGPRNNPVEWLVGVTLHPHPSLGLTFGAGSAVGPGVGAPEGRALFGFGWTPVKVEDTDGDGIKDPRDDCPETPEDFDGFEDEDGCPERDNDRDGIRDEDDDCPEIPEDEDGFEDVDGCPDEDNDRDKILDEDDECPDEPENYNGHEDEDGCPDDDIVVIDEVKQEIVILQKVFFDFNEATIRPESHKVLDAVAHILDANPHVERVEVQGHTDARGTVEYNRQLSQDRADSVRSYLIRKGVAEERLTAMGYGKSQPIAEGDTDEAHDQNRRVQFVIVEQE